MSVTEPLEGAPAAVDAGLRDPVRVPFLDLGLSHAPLKAEILADVAAAIDASAFTNGPAVAAFEARFAAYCGVEHCVGLASGLDALRLGLVAAGLRPGDEVVVPASTFVATVEAVTQAGGTPVLVDVDPADYTLDVAPTRDAVRRGARFVLPVHLYGQLADMRALAGVAAEHGAVVLEDACQAHGAERDGIRAGAGGTAAAFSFYPGKNLGAMGDGGALVTGDAAIAERVRALREHGQRRKYHHDEPGWTARLDALQALVLSRKLPHLDRWTAERRAVARAYTGALEGVGDLVLPAVPAGSDPVWHLYVIRTGDPEAMAERLRARDVASGRHYPQPIHLTDAYASLGHRAGDFPVAEDLAAHALSLPMFPGMTEAQVQAVVEAVRACFD